MINGVLIGHNDAELRTTTSGKEVAVFDLAVNNVVTNKTQWFTVEAWNGLGKKVVMPYVKKGSQVAVEIKDIDLNVWNGKDDGEARGKIIITADGVRLLDPKNG